MGDPKCDGWFGEFGRGQYFDNLISNPLFSEVITEDLLLYLVERTLK